MLTMKPLVPVTPALYVKPVKVLRTKVTSEEVSFTLAEVPDSTR